MFKIILDYIRFYLGKLDSEKSTVFSQLNLLFHLPVVWFGLRIKDLSG